MTLKVTTISGSPRGWRVLLALAFKGLTPEITLLNLSRQEHKADPFIALNPRGTVPVLEFEDVVIRDSMAILAWLDRKFPDSPIFGDTDAEVAEIWQIAMDCRQYLRQATADFLTPVFFGGASLADIGTPGWDRLTASADALQAELRRLDTALASGSKFLAGDVPSAADAVTWPEIMLIRRASETKSVLMDKLGLSAALKDLVRLEAWTTRVRNLPGVLDTMPPHWSTSR